MACHHAAATKDAVELAQRARDLIGDDDEDGRVFADYMLGRALVASGSYRAGASLLDGAIDAFAHTSPSARTLTSISLASFVTDRDDEARRAAEHALRIARAEGPIRVVQTLTLVAETYVRVGEWSRALAAVDEGLALARALEQSNIAGYFLMSRVRVEAGRGDETACTAHADEALPLIRAGGLVLPELLVEHSLGILELGLDRLDAAAATLQRVSARIAERELVGRDFIADADLVECLVRRGDRDDAAARLSAWEARQGDDAPGSTIALLRRCQGLLEEQFDVRFAEALALHATTVAPFPEARTRLCYGERLRRAGRRVDARVQLREALAIFERLDAEIWIGRCRREIRATGEKLGRREATGGDELTPQELQVALQVAEGKANKEVAAAMFLSPKTVEFHLSRVYRKLDISSRSELVRRFAARSA